MTTGFISTYLTASPVFDRRHTQRETFDVQLKEKTGLRHFYVMVEVNHSIDFNDRYTDDKKEGEPDYSGGPEGSGQPAFVYRADVDLHSARTTFDAVLIGPHSVACF